MAKSSVPLFVEVVSDFKPHTVASIAKDLGVSAGTVRALKKQTQAEGFKIIWTAEGYLLLPAVQMLTDKK